MNVTQIWPRTRITRRLTGSCAVLILLLGCGSHASNASNRSNPPPGPRLSDTRFATLQKELFNPFCVSCHSSKQGSAGVDLSTYAGITGKNSEEESLVDKDKPEQSLLLAVLTATSPDADPPRMPPRGPAIDAATVANLRAWLAAGSPPQ